MSDVVAAQPERVRGAGLWLVAQLVALLATVAVIVGLFLESAFTLRLLWKVIIPLVPASLLISPMLWRNVCPLATLNKLPVGPNGKGEIGEAGLARLAVLGMILLGVLVTARHVLFNGDADPDVLGVGPGAVLGVTVIAVALAALVLGQLFTRKVGFCNSFCPVLPVERLYGQSPLLQANNPRCPECNQCTFTGCIDLGETASIPQVLGRARGGANWVFKAYGIFAAAFPGFVLGYFLAADGPLDTTAHVFLKVGQWTVASYIVVAVLAQATRWPAKHFMPALAAAAVGLYYWFSGPILSAGLGLAPRDGGTDTVAIVIRAAAFALIAWWLWTAYARRAAAKAAA